MPHALTIAVLLGLAFMLALLLGGPWLSRLTVAAGGGWLALQLSGDLSHVFLAQSVGLTVFGLINAAAVAGGAWRASGQRSAVIELREATTLTTGFHRSS